MTFDPNCEGLAPSQSKAFGFVMQGPEAEPAFMARDTLISQGQEWKYTYGNVVRTNYIHSVLNNKY